MCDSTVASLWQGLRALDDVLEAGGVRRARDKARVIAPGRDRRRARVRNRARGFFSHTRMGEVEGAGDYLSAGSCRQLLRSQRYADHVLCFSISVMHPTKL